MDGVETSQDPLATPSQATETNVPTEVQAAVRTWTSRIKDAKKKWDAVYKEMRENMVFAAGFQWENQAKLHCEEYVANFCLRNLGQKVAQLYARDPQAEWQRRPRLDYAVWDGKQESLIQAVQGLTMNPMGDVQALAVLNDWMRGQQEKEMARKVGETLELLYQWNVDQHDPNFKEQMKQLVLRVLTCKVGFVRVSYETPSYENLQSAGMGDSILDRAKRVAEITKRLEESDTESTGALHEQLRQLARSLSVSLTTPDEDATEHLVFDFPPSTSIIVDPRCKNLKGFVGANWVVQEFLLPLDDVNAFFGTDLKSGGVTQYNDDGCPKESTTDTSLVRNEDRVADGKTLCCVWEVLNKQAKDHFFLVDGHKDYVQPPEPLDCKLHGFWPLRAIVFNNVEMIPGLKASIYPPSDCDLLRAAQKEWNRSRNSLRGHRKANNNQWLGQKNFFTEGDKDNIQNGVENQLIEIEAVPPQGMKLSDMIVPRPYTPIDPLTYQTQPFMEDVLLSTGSQEANLGPVPSGQTATGQTIAEQSKITVTTSNIDELDDLLTWLAGRSGEILLQKSAWEHVVDVVGEGAVWPQEEATRQKFLKQILLKVKAASSGRPNKALEIANIERLAPLILQAASLPPQMQPTAHALLRELINRLDERLEPSDFFPLMQLMSPEPGATNVTGTQSSQTPHPNPPGSVPSQSRPGPGKLGPRPQTLASEAPMPLVGA